MIPVMRFFPTNVNVINWSLRSETPWNWWRFHDDGSVIDNLSRTDVEVIDKLRNLGVWTYVTHMEQIGFDIMLSGFVQDDVAESVAKEIGGSCSTVSGSARDCGSKDQSCSGTWFIPKFISLAQVVHGPGYNYSAELWPKTLFIPFH